MPTAHNLAFVAGLCTAAAVGATFAQASDAVDVLRIVENRAQAHDRVVILANPVVLERMLLEPGRQRDNVLIDSGGAPLSRTAVASIRADVCDIREGYGTTETLSLTHFDRGSDLAAIGTVGQPLEGVDCRIVCPDPAIEVRTPLMGLPLAADLRTGRRADWFRTGDLGEMTPRGDLRILGREQDEKVGGLWPRDVLDELGPVLQYRTALVTHDDADTIRITTLRPLAPEDQSRVRNRLLDRIGGASAPTIQCLSLRQKMLYSAKLPRPGPG